MVKGISRRVIVVQTPDPRLFEQAIFILKDNAVNQEGVSDDALMKEARRLLREQSESRRFSGHLRKLLWACLGAALTGFFWAASILF